MPKPLRHVFVCQQQRPPGHPRGACAQSGAAEVLTAFLEEVQKRFLFDKIAVTASGCLGPCTLGCSVLVYPEGVMYGQVTKADVPEILDRHLLGGEPVARLQMPREIWG